MQGNLSQCDSELISRYYDEELDQVERSQVESHILVCSSCKKILEELKAISSQYGAHLARQSVGVDTRETEERVLDRLRRAEAPWWVKVKDTFFSKKILVSATATACVALLLIAVPTARRLLLPLFPEMSHPSSFLKPPGPTKRSFGSMNALKDKAYENSWNQPLMHRYRFSPHRSSRSGLVRNNH